ncbi:MAG: hypothetical protein LBK76_01380 [Verrucomicrobiales bacterium]|jgi:hypothetical protein|nr:hypothetical protein [Verrucomicrobiales bacterium]
MASTNSSGLKRFLPVGAFGISLALHLAVFLGISGIILIEAVAPKIVPQGDYQPATVSDLPPPPELPIEDTPALPDQAMTPDEALPATASLSPNLDAIAANAPANVPLSFAIPAAGGALGGRPEQSAVTSSERSNASAERRAPTFSPFGSADITKGGGLEGYFYDFKLTKDNKPTEVNVSQWQAIMKRFINSNNWNTAAELDNYYRSPKPLYVKKFFITTRGSGEAPKAFNLPNQPPLWSVLYRGKVIPPADGAYTFVGFGDDLMAVRVNGRLVLEGGWLLLANNFPMNYFPFEWSKNYRQRGLLRVGKSFTVKAGEPVKLEILIGDQGSICAYFLMLRKTGDHYEKLKDGTLKLPLFQLDSGHVAAEGECPPFATDAVPWKVAQ